MKKKILLTIVMTVTAFVLAGRAFAWPDFSDRFREVREIPPHVIDLPDPPVDTDTDGVADDIDNCVSVANADQADMDSDGEGDVCDDSDSDTIMDSVDNCPTIANLNQLDSDANGVGDVCDPLDTDGDGVRDAVDNCREMYNSRQSDVDADGLGDYCDNCRHVPNIDQADVDADGIGDVCEGDWDGDLVVDDEDNCWLKPNADQTDTDGDGLGDVCDPRCDGPACPAPIEVLPDEEAPAEDFGSGCSVIAMSGDASATTALVLMIMTALSIAGIRKQK